METDPHSKDKARTAKARSREGIIGILRAHEQELKTAGVKHLSLFGSTARDDADQNSDVDIAVRLDEKFSAGGLDYFWRLEQLQQQLAGLLGRPVDVVAEPVRQERFQRAIDQDRTLAF